MAILHGILIAVLSVGIGLSLGLTGGGGSILTVPVLVYVVGVAPRSAVGMSLVVVGVASLVAAIVYALRGEVRYKIGGLFAAGGTVGALLGSRLTYSVSPEVLLLIFAALLLLVAGLVLRRDSAKEELLPERESDAAQAAAIGMVAGVLTGFLGVGGGFVIVPSLTFLARLRLRQATATSLLVITVNSAAGLLGHLGQGDIDIPTTLLIAGLAAAGALVGAMLSRRIPAESLSRGFAFLAVVVALALIVKNAPILMQVK